MQAAKDGDRAAVSMLIRAWHRPLRACISTLMLGFHDADDIAQEVFLRAIERLDRVPEIESFGPFLRGIARNVIRERQRKFSRETRAYVQFAEEQSATAAAAQRATWLRDPELLAALRGCLNELPEKSQKMLKLRYDEQLNSDQIGRHFGLNGAAVRTAMRRARETLLKCIHSSYGPAIDTT